MKSSGRISVCILIVMSMLLSGCDKIKDTKQQINDESINLGSEQEQYYYTYEEVMIPETSVIIPDTDFDTISRTEKYFMAGDILYHTAILTENTIPPTFAGYYVQYLNMNNSKKLNWKTKTASVVFTVNGIEYTRYASPFFVMTDGKICAIAECDGKSYIAYLENGYPSKIGSEIGKDLVEKIKDMELYIDYEGKLYAFTKGMSEIQIYDAEFQFMETKSLQGKIYGILQARAGEPVCWYGLETDGKFCVKSIDAENILIEKQEINTTLFSATMTNDGTIYYADANGIWKWDGEIEKLYPLGQDYPFYEVYGIKVLEDGSIHLLVEMDEATILMIFQKSVTPLVCEKEEIRIGYLVKQNALNKSIARFNRKNEKYHVSMTSMEDPMGGDIGKYRDEIKFEVSTGGGPDIIGSDLIVDIEPFVKNGYLEDLTDLIPQQVGYTDAAFESCFVGDALYGIPYDYSIKTAIYSKKAFPDKENLTIEELMSAVENSEAKILQHGFDGVEIIYQYGLYDNENMTYIDWKNGESHLTDVSFIRLLEFAKRYADTGMYGEDEQELLADGISFAMSVEMSDLGEWERVYRYFEDTPALLGYPKVEGNGYFISGRELYLNANSKHKEGAREFLKYLLSEEEQLQYVRYDSFAEKERANVSAGELFLGHKAEFPVNKKALESLIEREKADLISNRYFMGNEDLQTVRFRIDEQMERFYYMVNHACPDNAYTIPLYSVLREELSPYFAGEISAKEAAEKLDKRVQLYLDEHLY